MGFGGGGSVQQPPEAEPVQPVPTEDDPKGIEEQRAAAKRAGEQEGYEGSLLTPGGHRGDTSDPGTKRKTLVGNLIG